MRAVGLVLLSACLMAAGVGRAETKFPYQLTVPSGGVALRSGPGPAFYATDRLAAGERIQVYREEKDGWLAVRPPPGSFSLVERRQLKAAEEPGVAVVLAEDVLACVGSRAEAVRTYISQVRLRKDERVELLDKWDDEATAAGPGDQAWCRIAPPAGEFRWLHADDLKREANSPAVPSSADPLPDGKNPSPTPKTSFEADGWQVRPVKTAAAPPRSSAASPPADVSQGWTQVPAASKPVESSPTDTARTASKAEPKTPAPIPIRVPVDGEKLATKPAAEKPAANGTNQPPSVLGTPAPLTSTPGTLVPAISEPAASVPATPAASTDQWTSRTPPPRQSIEELELDLSMMVAGDARGWRLAELRQRVEANLIRFETTAERNAARRLIERIAEFEQLQNRMAQATPQMGQPAPPAASSPPATASAPAEAGSNAAANVKYDGSGWLVPVHSTTGTAPPFALLDAQGEVLGYVSPTPGLNLQRYVRKQVGIFGLRGYVPSLNKPHVTAERVVDLDRHLR